METVKIAYWPDGTWEYWDDIELREYDFLGDDYTVIDIPNWMNESDIEQLVTQETKCK